MSFQYFNYKISDISTSIYGESMHKITKREMELLKICWEKDETTTRDIYEESLKEKKRSFNAVKTILDRMVVKGILKRRMLGHTALYTIATPKKNFIEKLIDDFVTNVLNGNMVPFFIHFVKKKKMTREQMQELKKIVDEMDEDEE